MTSLPLGSYPLRPVLLPETYPHRHAASPPARPPPTPSPARAAGRAPLLLPRSCKPPLLPPRRAPPLLPPLPSPAAAPLPRRVAGRTPSFTLAGLCAAPPSPAAPPPSPSLARASPLPRRPRHPLSPSPVRTTAPPLQQPLLPSRCCMSMVKGVFLSKILEKSNRVLYSEPRFEKLRPRRQEARWAVVLLRRKGNVRWPDRARPEAARRHGNSNSQLRAPRCDPVRGNGGGQEAGGSLEHLTPEEHRGEARQAAGSWKRQEMNLAVLPQPPHLRLYEFAKTALIKIFAFPYATVCDLYCDGGVDTDKWCDAQVGHYIGIDASASGVSDASELWENKRKPFTAEFIELDPSDDDFEAQVQEKGIQADIVCCMQHLQLCFESEERAKKLLNNVSSLLKPGGYFFGMTPDSSTIWTKYQKNVEASHNKGLKTVPNSIRLENYTIAFEVEEEKFPFFGKKYQLKFASEAMFENHCLVHFPSLMRLAREAGLEYVEIQNLTEFYDDNRTQFAPMLGAYSASFLDARGKLVTRSYDILGLYSTFVFQKPDPDAIPPIVTPDLHDTDNAHEEEWLRRQQASADDGRLSHTDVLPMDHEKGILGPGPADMRL